MQEDHAAVLTTRDKNTLKLPDYLRANLSSNLSGWIKSTFGPAYTCLQIAESLQTRDWKSTFTDAEKKKIYYFWQGQVSIKQNSLKLLRVLCALHIAGAKMPCSMRRVHHAQPDVPTRSVAATSSDATKIHQRRR